MSIGPGVGMGPECAERLPAFGRPAFKSERPGRAASGLLIRLRDRRCPGQVHLDLDAAILVATFGIVRAVELAVGRDGAAFAQRDDGDPVCGDALPDQIIP